MREARKLKSSYEQVELLKEKLSEERGRRERAEIESAKLLELQANMKELEAELSSWKLLMEEIPSVSCRDDILSKFAALQKYVKVVTLLLCSRTCRSGESLSILSLECALAQARVQVCLLIIGVYFPPGRS